MNQNLKKLKDKVRNIDEKVEAGEAVQINLSKDDKTAEPLLVNADKTRDPDTGGFKSGSRSPVDGLSKSRARDVDSGGRSTGDKNDWSASDSATPEDFDINFTDIDLTDEDIHEIIKSAAPRGAKTRSLDSDALPPVNVTYDVPTRTWILTSDCVYRTDNGWTITAKKDFAFDLASVPRFLWVIISSFDLSLIAPLYHDLLYRHGGLLPDGQLDPAKNPPYRFSRKEADDILYELMERARVPWWKRQAAYRAVRTFSAFAWKD